MDKNKTDTLIFLDYWDNPNPTSDQQMGFMLFQMDNESECENLGKVYSNEFLYKKNKKEAIKNEIKKHHPKWVIGMENSATILLSVRRQKKILINPTVTDNDLNWITEEDINDTYAFFSANFEKDYEIYSKVYRNATFYPLRKILSIGDVKTIITEIIDKASII